MINTTLARPRKGRTKTNAPKLGPIDSKSDEPIERQVYKRLQIALMSGLIAPDTILTGRSLAEELEVSVQPVRDALKRLEAASILESRPQSGFFLRSITQSEYMEITQIRTNLEGMAGHHAAACIPPKVIAQLRDLNEKMSGLSDPREYLAANFRIHFTIYRLPQCAELLKIIQNLWMRIGPVLHNVQYDVDYSGVAATHEEIFAALERGDGPATARALSKDLLGAAKIIVAQLQPERPSAESDPELWLLAPEDLQ